MAIQLKVKMTNFILGGITSIIFSALYILGSFACFTFADRGQPISTVLSKVNPYTLTNLGQLPGYLAVTQYNKGFSDAGHHADLIRLLSNAKQGIVLILWTPTCPKCKVQLKALAQISKKYKKIKFVAVVSTFGSTLDAAKKYWKKNVGTDHNMILIEDSVQNKNSIFRTIFTATNQAAVPMTVFVNTKLEILSAVAGSIKWDLHASQLMNCKFEK